MLPGSALIFEDSRKFPHWIELVLTIVDMTRGNKCSQKLIISVSNQTASNLLVVFEFWNAALSCCCDFKLHGPYSKHALGIKFVHIRALRTPCPSDYMKISTD